MGIINFITQNAIVLDIVVILVILIGVFLNKKFRSFVYDLMAKAEENKLTYDVSTSTIDKLQKSDLDERMVLVIANIIHSLPILHILPKSFVISFLNNYVQKAFNNIKDLLKARREKVLQSKEIISENITEDINTSILSARDKLIAEMAAQAATNSIKEYFDKILPQLEERKSNDFISNVLDSTSKVENAVDTVEEYLDTAKDYVDTSKVEKVLDDIKENTPKVKDIVDKADKIKSFTKNLNIGGTNIKVPKEEENE